MDRLLNVYPGEIGLQDKTNGSRGSIKKKFLTVTLYLGFCCIMALVYMEWEYENDSKDRSVFGANLHKAVLEIERECPRLCGRELDEVDFRVFTRQKLDDITELKDKLGIGNDYRKEAWSFIGAFFFVLTTTTTIGYGYPAPKTVQGRVTTMLLYMVGVPFTFMALMDMVDLILTFEQFIGTQIVKASQWICQKLKQCYTTGFKNVCCKKKNSVAPIEEVIPNTDTATTGNLKHCSKSECHQHVSFEMPQSSASTQICNSTDSDESKLKGNNGPSNDSSNKSDVAQKPNPTSPLSFKVIKTSSAASVLLKPSTLVPSASAETTQSHSDLATDNEFKMTADDINSLKSSEYSAKNYVNKSNVNVHKVQVANKYNERNKPLVYDLHQRNAGVESVVSVRIGSHTELIPRRSCSSQESTIIDIESEESCRNIDGYGMLSNGFSESVAIQIEPDNEKEIFPVKDYGYRVFSKPKFYIESDSSESDYELKDNINNNAKTAKTEDVKTGSGVTMKTNVQKSVKHVLNSISTKGESVTPKEKINISVINASSKALGNIKASVQDIQPGVSETSFNNCRSSRPASRDPSFHSGHTSRKSSYHNHWGSYPTSRKSSMHSRYSSQPPSRWSSLHRASLASQHRMNSSKHIQQPVDDSETLPHLTLAFTMTNLIIYICLGAILYVQFEGWTYVDSIYFILTSISTVGFGDLLPKSELFLLQSSFYILLGLALLGKVIGDIRKAMYNFMVRTVSKIEDVGQSAKEKIAKSARKMSLMQLSKRSSFTTSKKASKQSSRPSSRRGSITTEPSHEYILNVRDLQRRSNQNLTKGSQDNTLQSKWPDHLPLPGHPGLRPWSPHRRRHTVPSLNPFAIADIPESDDQNCS